MKEGFESNILRSDMYLCNMYFAISLESHWQLDDNSHRGLKSKLY